MKTRPDKLSDNQRGFAAIVVALVLILVLSLITVGFAQLMRREQNSALNKQLNSQAYYAAESGVNAAMAAINAGDYGNPPVASKSLCGPDTHITNQNVGTVTGASFPCLLINPTPSNLQYSPVDTTDTKVVEFTAVDPNNLNQPAAASTIRISWQDAGASQSFASGCGAGSFSPAGTWGNTTGVLRAELIPLNNASSNASNVVLNDGLDRKDLINNELTAFLCPTATSGSPVTYDSISTDAGYNTGTSSQNGMIINGGCSTTTTPRYCNAFITGLNGTNTLNEATFFLTLRSIYNPTAVTIMACSQDVSACTPGNSSVLNIADAQVLIDSTGKAQDVLRRIQVRVPVHNNYDIPNGTGATQSLCKLLQLTPGGGTTGDGTNCTSLP